MKKTPQEKYEEKVGKVQKKIENLLSKNKMALVANYVKETKTVHLELIPTELLEARKTAMESVVEQPAEPILDANPETAKTH